MQSQDRRPNVYEAEASQASAQRQAVCVAALPQVQRSVHERKLTEPTTEPAVKRAAFIGTRRVEEVARDAHDTYLDLVERAVGAGYTIRTGAAPGADQIAASRALHLGGSVDLVLPWPTYQAAWISKFITEEDQGRLQVIIYNAARHVKWFGSVYEYHPTPDKLSDAAFKLHARNYGILEPCDVVVALRAPDQKGGTEQGIRIAKGLGLRWILLETRDRGGRVVLGEGDATLSWTDLGVSVQLDSIMD